MGHGRLQLSIFSPSFSVRINFVCAAYSAGDVSTLLVSMAVPTVLGDTKLVFTDLLDEEEEPESYLPLSADLKV